MLSAERYTQIINSLSETGFCSVEELCHRVYASASTIRRDLTVLQEQGVLERVWGGALLSHGSNRDTPVLIRKNENVREKRKMAQLAARYMRDSSSIFLDSSSSCAMFATRLKAFSNLTVVTNGLDTLNTLNNDSNMRVIACGGTLRANFEFVGQVALDTIARYRADLFFFSCSGLSVESGITEKDESNAAVKRQFFQYSKKRILLCDSSKFDQSFFCNAFDLSDIDIFISDSEPSNPKLRAAIRKKLIC